MWLPLYHFNIFNILNPKTHASQKGIYKMSISFFNSKSTSRSVFALNNIDSEVLVSYKRLDLQVLFPWPQESSQSDIRVKRYVQNTKTSQNIGFFSIFGIGSNEFLSFLLCFHTSLTH